MCNFFSVCLQNQKKALYLHSRLRQVLKKNGSVVQLVRIRACHARGRGFESRPDRLKPHSYVGLFLLCTILTSFIQQALMFFIRVFQQSQCIVCVSTIMIWAIIPLEKGRGNWFTWKNSKPNARPWLMKNDWKNSTAGQLKYWQGTSFLGMNRLLVRIRACHLVTGDETGSSPVRTA